MLRRPAARRLAARNALWVALASLAGCATRHVPAAFPPSSAASERAVEAPPAVVTRALTEEPPWSDEIPGPHAGHEPATRDANASHHDGGHHEH